MFVSKHTVLLSVDGERQAFLYMHNKDISPYDFAVQTIESLLKDTPFADIELLAIETRRVR